MATEVALETLSLLVVQALEDRSEKLEELLLVHCLGEETYRIEDLLSFLSFCSCEGTLDSLSDGLRKGNIITFKSRRNGEELVKTHFNKMPNAKKSFRIRVRHRIFEAIPQTMCHVGDNKFWFEGRDSILHSLKANTSTY